ncbi:hypothetical protein, partial [Pseudomonas savastanoi]|uniref:hypothetical protein n=1 Tax=Pseudomonas savastanoi TaxID=29438 RepID=UPI001C7FDBB3
KVLQLLPGRNVCLSGALKKHLMIPFVQAVQKVHQLTDSVNGVRFTIARCTRQNSAARSCRASACFQKNSLADSILRWRTKAQTGDVCGPAFAFPAKCCRKGSTGVNVLNVHHPDARLHRSNGK